MSTNSDYARIKAFQIHCNIPCHPWQNTQEQKAHPNHGYDLPHSMNHLKFTALIRVICGKNIQEQKAHPNHGYDLPPMLAAKPLEIHRINPCHPRQLISRQRLGSPFARNLLPRTARMNTVDFQSKQTVSSVAKHSRAKALTRPLKAKAPCHPWQKNSTANERPNDSCDLTRPCQPLNHLKFTALFRVIRGKRIQQQTKVRMTAVASPEHANL